MASQAVEVILPTHLLQEIDSLVGQENRSNFLAESAQQALQQQRLHAFFLSKGPVWKDEDHPDLAAMGTEAWVRALRDEAEDRFQELHRDQ